LTFKLLLHYVLVTEHDPASGGHQPESERVKGPVQRARKAAEAA
jgi:hypothetical protein